MATGGGGYAATGDGGGLGGGRGGGVNLDEGEMCGSSNPVAAPNTSLFPAAAVALARTWKARPEDSYQWTSALGGVYLDDEVWEVRFHFAGKDNLERKIGESDITYLNLLALIEAEGYTFTDSMYYVKEEGIGRAGMAVIKSMKAVEEMMTKYSAHKCFTIFVVKGSEGLPAGINSISVEEHVPISEIGMPVVYEVNVQGVLFKSQPSALDVPVIPIDLADGHVLTQQSIVPVIDSEDDSDMEPDDIDQRIIDLKRKKPAPSVTISVMETDDEAGDDLFNDSDTGTDDSDCIIEPVKSVKKQKTSGAHCGEASSSMPDFMPSSEDTDFYDNVLSDDDDQFEPLSFVLPNGVKSRAKKKEPRKWYDEKREHPEDQLCLKMCFVDVYQFRRMLQQFHIAQLRNYFLHRNNRDRVMAKCADEECSST